MLFYSPRAYKDKPWSVMLGRGVRRHILKLILGAACMYLIYTMYFFGTLSESSKEAQVKREERKRNLDIKLPKTRVNNEDQLLSEEKSIYKDEVNDKDKSADKEERPEARAPPDPKPTKMMPTFQEIDIDEAHRKQRLAALAKAYSAPRSSDETHKLNETQSRAIDLDRPPADLRPEECADIEYDYSKLPTISIILPIYNEALSMVLRAVHGAINNTPQQLLVDIILVDDDSTNENLKGPLDDYLKHLPNKVQVLHNKERLGLIRARMAGAKLARGEVFLFQDSHTEFNPGWAEPALDYIRRYPNTVLQPTVEELDPTRITWPDKRPINHQEMWRGVFMWDMRFAWNRVPNSYSSWKLSPTDPYPNAVLVGCSVIVQKDFFYKIGGFDEGLNVWGGENIELSLRTWMCGGKMVIHPCSRIAHVFKPFSYSFDGNKEKIIGKNSIRVVEAWMDQHRDYYYASNFVYEYKRISLDEKDKNSLREHKALREKLKCKSFDWYLETVLPEMNLPRKDAFRFGEVQNIASKMCWQVEKDGYITMTADCYTYSRLKPEAEFSFNKDGRITYGDKCVSVQDNLLLQVVPCGTATDTGFAVEPRQEYGEVVGIIVIEVPGQPTRCLQQITNILPEIHYQTQMPQFMNCKKDEWQTWYISYHFNFDLVPEPPV